MSDNIVHINVSSRMDAFNGESFEGVFFVQFFLLKKKMKFLIWVAIRFLTFAIQSIQLRKILVSYIIVDDIQGPCTTLDTIDS